MLKLKPADRANYPNLKSITELKKLKLQPLDASLPDAHVIRRIYGNYYLYDISKTEPYQITEEEKLKNKEKRLRNRSLYTCPECKTYLGVKRGSHYAECGELEYYNGICEDCFLKYRNDGILKIEAAFKECEKNIPEVERTLTICLDVETTGLYQLDEILQLSIIDNSGNVLFNSYIKPYANKTWKAAERINHISPGYIFNENNHFPYPHEVLPDLYRIFNQTKKIIGYNTSFDIGFINEWHLISPEIEEIDVMEMFAPIYGEVKYYDKYTGEYTYKRQKLIKCAEFFNYTFNAHDALEDAKATLYCYKKIIDS